MLSINQIVRGIGFSMGSALAGFLLAAATPTGTILPTQGGYITAALWTLPPITVSAVIVAVRRPTRRSKL